MRALDTHAGHELFDLAALWSSEALSGNGVSPGLDLVSYARAQAPLLAAEAAAVAARPLAGESVVPLVGGGCTCSAWATFSTDSGSASAGGWPASHAAGA